MCFLVFDDEERHENTPVSADKRDQGTDGAGAHLSAVVLVELLLTCGSGHPRMSLGRDAVDFIDIEARAATKRVESQERVIPVQPLLDLLRRSGFQPGGFDALGVGGAEELGVPDSEPANSACGALSLSPL